MYYILNDDYSVTKTGDVAEWAKSFESSTKHVQNNVIDGVRVSTVFLGIDHSYTAGAPLLFETMVFYGGSVEADQIRYSTYEEAYRGHQYTVLKIARGDYKE